MPQGLTLAQNDGELAGMPSSAGGYSFTVKVTDANSQSAQKAFVMNIGSGGSFDGPAELPRVTVSSAMSDTPAPGATVLVNAGGDLQTALNNARCGDTVELQAGAVFAGVFSFPAKSCDNGHWVIVRTNAPDSALPAEGTRVNPCYAGVASLPGRPPFTCPKTQNVMARLEYNKTVDGPIIFRTGANHYRLIGLEITRTAGIKSAPALASLEFGGIGDHIILDRSWLHGTVQDETQSGISLTGMTNVAIIDSYFSDFHCTSELRHLHRCAHHWRRNRRSSGRSLQDRKQLPRSIGGRHVARWRPRDHYTGGYRNPAQPFLQTVAVDAG